MRCLYNNTFIPTIFINAKKIEIFSNKVRFLSVAMNNLILIKIIFNFKSINQKILRNMLIAFSLMKLLLISSLRVSLFVSSIYANILMKIAFISVKLKL